MLCKNIIFFFCARSSSLELLQRKYLCQIYKEIMEAVQCIFFSVMLSCGSLDVFLVIDYTRCLCLVADKMFFITCMLL